MKNELKELKENIKNIKKKIVVISGKGGVGKSSISSNLSVYCATRKKCTGLLDIDIHGPSIPLMMGLQDRKVELYDENTILPIQYNEYLKVISIGFLLSGANDAVIWRGPKKYSLIKQFLEDVKWEKLDYLIVDCPPGTGDEPLGIVQLLGDVDGAVVVTTPQDVALNDVKRSITFCKQLEVPVLGVIENMSGFVCPKCSAQINIFKQGGGTKLADQMKVPYLGSIPIFEEIVEKGDSGKIIYEYTKNELIKEKMNNCFSKIIHE